LVGPSSVGSPQVEDSHRADPVTMKRFRLETGGERKSSQPVVREISADVEQLALRRLRPSRPIDVECERHTPASVRWNGVRYPVTGCAGPWRSSGDWWDVDAWARDEWDVALSDGTLCRLAHDLRTGAWFLHAVYD